MKSAVLAGSLPAASTFCAQAAIIGFDSLASAVSGTYAEDGFTFALVDTVAGNNFGNPAPSLLFLDGTARATMTVDGGGLFQFAEFDLADGGLDGATGVTISGILGGISAFSETMVPSDNFVAQFNPFAGTTVGTLLFDNDAGGGFVNINNIAAPVVLAALGTLAFPRGHRRA